ncbi:MAG TPA: porin family protein [Daejeonella sp.]|nr:porin family protein [Daejeonella sp.]
MKTRLLLLVIISLIGGHLHAQNAKAIYVGVQGGLSIPNLTAGGSNTNPLNTGYGSRLAPGFAAFIEFKISRFFSIQPMVEYSSQGGKKNGFQALTTPDDLAPLFGPNPPQFLFADYKSVAKINYLMVPILAKFGWNLNQKSPWHLFFNVGPFASYLLNAHQITRGTSTLFLDANGQIPVPDPQNPGSNLVIPLDANTNIRSDLHRFNFGVEGGLGIAYHIHQSSIFIEGGGNYGFLNIQKGTANGKNNTGAATVMLGFAHKL